LFVLREQATSDEESHAYALSTPCARSSGACPTGSTAARLESAGIKPLKPGRDGPAYDLAWQKGGPLFVAEVKSLTARNESKQLRLALGQVLDYADQLVRRGHDVRRVIAAEVEPAERRWVELCLSLGVTIV
jgi:hypothetical protein